MNGKNRILFSDLKKSVHSQRFIDALSEHFEVFEHYENQGKDPKDLETYSHVFVATLIVSLLKKEY
jgi:hypothetical protein